MLKTILSYSYLAVLIGLGSVYAVRILHETFFQATLELPQPVPSTIVMVGGAIFLTMTFGFVALAYLTKPSEEKE